MESKAACLLVTMAERLRVPSRRRPSGKPRKADQAIHVGPEFAGKTLAEVVRRGIGVSWGEAERRILGRLVAVHGNLCMDPARRLRAGDVVNLRAEAMDKPPEPDDVRIVFRDRHLVVVDKPAGVVSVRERRESGMSPKRRERQPTLDELVARRLKRPHDDRPPRVLPVHRLDRDTSGLMVFALTPDAERGLLATFKAHDLERAYRAVVLNGLPAEGKIVSHLARDRGDGRRGSVEATHQPDARRAVTHVRPVEQVDGRGVVECRLETGRTHQIRIHMSEAGHPICGDKVYGPRREENPPPRQALHAFMLEFDHPVTGRRVEAMSDWPRDLARWLAWVGGRG
jgi:23S rRNA pseudouridine1911/1915/1917 synthase